MAWQAQLITPITYEGDQIVASFGFYDDADPANQTTPSVYLHIERFTFPPSWSNADMQARIRARGAQVRSTVARATVMATTFPVTTTIISVP